ncbi:MAG: alpha/beta hydrolase [Anaerolineae bacterium]|nr:alpha/beta hydrolase [Anaerolineae bacterium]
MNVEIIPLWSEGVMVKSEQETVITSPRFNNQVKDMKVVRNVTQASMTAYLPDAAVAKGAAVVICPGGGFSALPIEIEGTNVAQWLSTHGIAAFVLKYRLLPTADDDQEFLRQHQRPDMAQINGQIPLAVSDGIQAIHVVRERAAEWHIDPQHIGILGFSAGGVVAAGVCSQTEAESSPNFVASIYSPGSPDLMPQEKVLPLFMAFASDDPVITMVSDGSMQLYSAWKDAKQPVELHIYAQGGHGFGMTQQNIPCDHWIDRFAEWLGQQG